MVAQARGYRDYNPRMAEDISPADLAAALAAHAARPKDASGQRLDLSDRALPAGPALRGACLSQSDLSGATFHGVDLSEADLTDAILRDADLSRCINLNAAQLGGSDLTGAILPEPIAKFELLKTVSDASGQAKALFVSMLAACAYCGLTIGATKDVALLSDAGTSQLPLISASVPISGFYLVTPILLVLLFLYFHISLHRLWEMLADLPAVFPDGAPLDQRAYPWLLTGVVRSRMSLLQKMKPPLTELQTFISVLLAYAVVPVTLVAFWVRHLPRHDWTVSALLEGLIVGSTGLAFLFYGLSRSVLTRRAVVLPVALWLAPAAVLMIGNLPGLPLGILGFDRQIRVTAVALAAAVAGALVDLVRRHHLRVRGPSFGMMLRAVLPQLALALALTLVLGVLTGGSIAGNNPDAPTMFPGVATRKNAKNPCDWVPVLWRKLHFDPFLNVAGEDVSPKTGSPARLQGRNISNAIADEANLAGADLRNADLSHTSLRYANLRDADLSGADLQGAFLMAADLAGADLSGALIAGGSFATTSITPAQLLAARGWQETFILTSLSKDLDRSDLRWAQLRGADLSHMSLYGNSVWLTDFRGVTLRADQVTQMLGWRSGWYDPPLLKTLKLPDQHNANVDHCKFDNYDLHLADFRDLDLRSCSFSGAILSSADLSGANLSSVSLEGADLDGATASRQPNLFKAGLRGARHLPVPGSKLGGCMKELAYGNDQDHNQRLGANNLRGAHLSGCNLAGSFLNDGDFRQVDLSNADLTGTEAQLKLDGANLAGANLLFADIHLSTGLTDDQVRRSRNWQFADLPPDMMTRLHGFGRRVDYSNLNLGVIQWQGAPLGEGKFRSSDLSHADLSGANLANTDFTGATLTGAILNKANLTWADFRGAKGLTAEQVRDARDWRDAYLDPDLLKQLGLSADHNEVLARLYAKMSRH